MLRHLGFLGFLALFSAAAFVQPGQGQAMKLKEIGEMIPRSVSFHDVHDVVPLVTNIAEEHLVPAIRQTAEAGVKNIVSARARSKDVWRDTASEFDASVQHTFLEIEWAREKNDRSSCSSLTLPSLSGTSPTSGDWVAYCFARVTGNPDRCEQISDGTQPALRTVCEKELTSNTGTLSFLATLLPW